MTDKTNAGYFVAWITYLLSEYESKLILALIKKGYGITAAAKDKVLSQGTKDNASILTAIMLFTDKPEATVASVHLDIQDIIQEERMYVYSMVVSEMADHCWSGTNIQFPTTSKTPPSLPPHIPSTNKNMN
jgi:phosphomevalonate kinase